MEVSSVARSLGQNAEQWLLEKQLIGGEQTGLIPTIAATCGLIHDLGNPPFGHAGEQAISDWFSSKHQADPSFFSAFRTFAKDANHPEETQHALDFLKFEGNAQTLRLVAKLQVLADNFGLNLTCGTLSAACKYVAASNTINKKQQETKKHGYFLSETELISRIRKEVDSEEFRNPIAFLVEAADDIVYSTVDLEDGVKKGVISWDSLEKLLNERAASDGALRKSLDSAHAKIDPADLRPKMRDEAMAVAFRTFAIAELVVAASKAFQDNYDSIMTGSYHKEILYDSSAAQLARACKQIGFDFIYVSQETLRLEIMGRKVIQDLMELFWQASSNYDKGQIQPLQGFNKKIYELISPNYRQIFEENVKDANAQGIPEEYFKMQLVTDHVSGMTDSYATSLHRELSNG
jgi:dGTPase